MSDIEKSISLRKKRIKRQNRYALVQLFIANILFIYLANTVLWASVKSVGLIDVIRIVFSTIGLMIIWFYSLDERESHENIARGLASDLLIGMAVRITQNLIADPRYYANERMKDGLYIHSSITITNQQASILEVSNRIGSHIVANQSGMRIKGGWMPRLSSIKEEYTFTEEDLEAIITAMVNDKKRVGIYKTIIDLIQESQPRKI